MQRHGIANAPAAQGVLWTGDLLRQRARQTSVEWVAIVDRETGAQVGPAVSGGSDEVSIESLLPLMQSGRRYVALHTHRSIAAFSDLDATVLCTHSAIRAIAVGHNRTWYFLSKRPGIPLPSPEVVVALVRAAVVQARTPYLPKVAARRLSRAEAKRRILHEVWRFLAPRLGLDYDRVQETTQGRDDDVRA